LFVIFTDLERSRKEKGSEANHKAARHHIKNCTNKDIK